MTQNSTLPTLAVRAGNAAGAASEQNDAEFIRLHVHRSRLELLKAVEGLTREQWHFKPAPDRWSAAEILEHCTIVQEFIVKLVENISQAPEGSPDRDIAGMDAILLGIPERTAKFQAPPPTQPTGRWTTEEALQRFEASRIRFLERLKTNPDLRRHVRDHPAFGLIDGYQWILASAMHTIRHTRQILRLKADPCFPQA